MRGGKRAGAGRKKKPDYLRREPMTIRLPQWMISQLKKKVKLAILSRRYWQNKTFLMYQMTTISTVETTYFSNV